MQLSKGTLNTTESAKQKIGKNLRSLWSNNKKIYASYKNRKLYFPTRQELDAILSQNVVVAGTNTCDLECCEDYAFILKGKIALFGRNTMDLQHPICMGIAWGRFKWVNGDYHAANWTIDADGEIYWVEPQQQNAIYPFDGQCLGDLTAILV